MSPATNGLWAHLPFPVLSCVIALGLLSPVKGADNASEPEVEKILPERVSVLQEAAKLRRDSYRVGASSLRSVLTADGEVIEAELELARTSEDRLRLREKMLELAKSLESATAELVKSSEIPSIELLSARANRLRAEADILIERKAAGR